jgi:hypothetical protein
MFMKKVLDKNHIEIDRLLKFWSGNFGRHQQIHQKATAPYPFGRRNFDRILKIISDRVNSAFICLKRQFKLLLVSLECRYATRSQELNMPRLAPKPTAGFANANVG